MTRVFPLPAPARMSTGPSVVSTASRCCGLSWERKDNDGNGSRVADCILQGNYFAVFGGMLPPTSSTAFATALFRSHTDCVTAITSCLGPRRENRTAAKRRQNSAQGASPWVGIELDASPEKAQETLPQTCGNIVAHLTF